MLDLISSKRREAYADQCAISRLFLIRPMYDHDLMKQTRTGVPNTDLDLDIVFALTDIGKTCMNPLVFSIQRLLKRSQGTTPDYLVFGLSLTLAI